MKLVAVLLLACLLVANAAAAQVAVDSVTDGGAQNSASSQTFAHTVSGSNRELLVTCAVHDGVTVSSITYNGTPLTFQGRGQDSIPDIDAEIWSLTAPVTGTHNVVVTLSGSNNFACTAASFTGVNQTTPIGNVVTDGYPPTGTSHSHNTTVVANGLIWDLFTVDIAAGAVTANAGQTLRSGPTDTVELRALVTSRTGSGSVSTGYSWVNDFNHWGHVTVALQPVVTTPPTITKAFSPTTIAINDISRLTITLSNPNASAISLSAAFTDTFPSGLQVATVPNISNSCGAGTVSAPAGGSTVTLTAASTIPPVSCAIGVDVTAAAAGTYVDTIPAGALQTSGGNNASPASASLAVTAITPVPTLSEWSFILLAMLLGAAGVLALRTRTAR